MDGELSSWYTNQHGSFPISRIRKGIPPPIGEKQQLSQGDYLCVVLYSERKVVHTLVIEVIPVKGKYMVVKLGSLFEYKPLTSNFLCKTWICKFPGYKQDMPTNEYLWWVFILDSQYMRKNNRLGRGCCFSTRQIIFMIV